MPDSPGRHRAAPEALRFTGTTVEGRPFDGAALAGEPTVTAVGTA